MIEHRRSVLKTGLAHVENMTVAGLSRARTPPVHSPQFQVLFPLTGVFNWHLGSSDSLLDVNQILFIAAGDESQDSHPGIGDVSALLLTPETGLLEVAWGCGPARLPGQRAFRKRVLPSDPRLQQAAAAIARCAAPSIPPDDTVLEEAVVALLAATASHSGSRTAKPGRGSKLVRAVKEIVSTCDERVSLIDLGERLGVSPAYLTDAFRRREGMPIAQYHRRLRLARALSELPHTDDITALALRFGFSSHAHFSSSFRAVFGRSPSEYRARARRFEFRELLKRVAT